MVLEIEGILLWSDRLLLEDLEVRFIAAAKLLCNDT